jgi:tetratricopeptide (TPR) repeat protein
MSLHDRGDLDEAITEYRETIRLGPNTRPNPSIVVEGPIGEYREMTGTPRAIEFPPVPGLQDLTSWRASLLAGSYYLLGLALYDLGRLDEAIEAFQEVIRLSPDFDRAYASRAFALRRKGDFGRSLAAFRRAHERGSSKPGSIYPWAQWVADAERMAALADQLPEILKGRVQPRDATECLTYARMAYEINRPAAAARLWARAMESDPTLGDDLAVAHRYNAACAAALAGCGKGRDDPPPDDATRANLRGLALNWLWADLGPRSKQLETDAAEARRALTDWKGDPDLAGVRDSNALDNLPDKEQKEWRALWADVDSLLKKAQGP